MQNYIGWIVAVVALLIIVWLFIRNHRRAMKDHRDMILENCQNIVKRFKDNETVFDNAWASFFNLWRTAERFGFSRQELGATDFELIELAICSQKRLIKQIEDAHVECVSRINAHRTSSKTDVYVWALLVSDEYSKLKDIDAKRQDACEALAQLEKRRNELYGMPSRLSGLLTSSPG